MYFIHLHFFQLGQELGLQQVGNLLCIEKIRTDALGKNGGGLLAVHQQPFSFGGPTICYQLNDWHTKYLLKWMDETGVPFKSSILRQITQ